MPMLHPSLKPLASRAGARGGGFGGRLRGPHCTPAKVHSCTCSNSAAPRPRPPAPEQAAGLRAAGAAAAAVESRIYSAVRFLMISDCGSHLKGKMLRYFLLSSLRPTCELCHATRPSLTDISWFMRSFLRKWMSQLPMKYL